MSAPDPRAIDAIRISFHNLIKPIKIGFYGLETPDPFYANLDSLAKKIAKNFCPYMNEDDSKLFASNYIYRLYQIANLSSDSKSTPISELFKLDSVSSDFISNLTKIPYPLQINFPLTIAENDFIHTEFGTSKKIFCGERINQHNTNKTKELFFSITALGYAGRSFNSPTLKEAMRQFKIMLAIALKNRTLHIRPPQNPLMQHFILMPIRNENEHLDAGLQYPEDSSFDTSSRITMPRSLTAFIRSLGADACPADAPEFVVQRHIRSAEQTTTLLTTSEKSADQVKSACEWYIDALSTDSEALRLIQICTGLEAIYGDTSSNGGLTESLSDRCAYALGRNHLTRAEIKRSFRQLYQLRSKIVHGVTNSLLPADRELLHFGIRVLEQSIDNEINLLCNEQIN